MTVRPLDPAVIATDRGADRPTSAETQRRNAGATFACTWVRFRGGLWRVVLTPEQWATYHRETL